MRKMNKEHIARPMDAYRKKSILKCIDNPETAYRCKAVKKTCGYRSVKAIIAEFELIGQLDINSNEPTF
jgi:hypothetical protein